MKKLLILSFFFIAGSSLFSQTAVIIQGTTNTINLVKKSSKLPSIKLKDGSTIVLRYDLTDGIHAEMYKNGKNFDLVEPFAAATFVQISEVDIDKDGKNEIVIGARTSADQFTVQILRKPEFETEWMVWSTVTGQSYCEFPGDNTIKVFTLDGTGSILKFFEDGTFKAVNE